jgi:hypothetical protein
MMRWSAALKAPLKSAYMTYISFLVELRVLYHDDDGGEGVVDAAVLSKAVLLVAENAVGLGVFRACVFD